MVGGAVEAHLPCRWRLDLPPGPWSSALAPAGRPGVKGTKVPEPQTFRTKSPGEGPGGVYFRNTLQVILVAKENRQGGKIQVRASATGRQGTGTKGEKEGRR